MLTLAMLCNKISPAQDPAARARRAQALVGLTFLASFASITAKIILCASDTPSLPVLAAASAPPPLTKTRPDIVDRNGRLLATDIRVYWLYANPQQLVNADDAAEKVASLFPELNQAALAKKFRDKNNRFEWVKRGLTPRQAQAVHKLGIPGFYLMPALQRVYPAGNAAAHILGVTNVDNHGIGGIEKYIDDKLASQVQPLSGAVRPIVKLSLDLGVQHVLAEELSRARDLYRAQAAMGLVLDAQNGEVLASASLPDFDPNHRDEAIAQNRQNRVVTDVYELGSVFKCFTIAMALDQSIVTPADLIDTVTALRAGHFRLHDAHASRGPMSVEDIFVHSSNIGAARIALMAGASRQRAFLQSFSFFDRLETEAGVSPKPEFPKIWRPANVMTIAYGHGIAVSPLLFASGVATLVNGGQRIKPTFLLAERGADEKGEQLIKPETSATMRELMRLTVLRGTGRKAAVPGLSVGGKTGTALKVKNGRYTHDVVNSFVAAFPIDRPKYLVMVTLDEPKAETPGKSDEAAANAAPTAGAIIKRIAPMLDVLPTGRFDEAVSTPYEKIGTQTHHQAISRNKNDEFGGVGQGYYAFEQRDFSGRSPYFRPYGR